MKLKKIFFKSVNSTNNTAIRLIKKQTTNLIIISEIQKKGKGQRGKKWISKKGNLFTSIVVKIDNKITVDKITKINVKVIKKVIDSFININSSIKLPNDILIDNRKVCGILQETIFKNNSKYLIIGIGINIVNKPIIKGYNTTFLENHSKKKINKIQVVNKLKIEFEKIYKKQY
tara:strand:+ start:2187 stop:2708 length:522 start_codon:yes stop_codon:yes gene_type:complete